MIKQFENSQKTTRFANESSPNDETQGKNGSIIGDDDIATEYISGGISSDVADHRSDSSPNPGKSIRRTLRKNSTFDIKNEGEHGRIPQWIETASPVGQRTDTTADSEHVDTSPAHKKRSRWETFANICLGFRSQTDGGLGSEHGKQKKKEKTKSIWWTLDAMGDVSAAHHYDEYGQPTEDNIPHFPFLVLNPRSLSRVRWDIFMMILLYLSLLVTTFRVAFESTQLRHRNQLGQEPGWGVYNSYLIYLEYLMDYCFFLDFLLQFRTAYFTRGIAAKDGDQLALVTNPWRILIRYLRTWCVLDAVCCIPWEFAQDMYALATNVVDTTSWKRIFGGLVYLRIFRVLRYVQLRNRFRLTRIGRLDKHIQTALEWAVLHNGLVRLIKLFLVIVMQLHLAACLMFFLGTLSLEPGDGTSAFYTQGGSWIQRVNLVVSRCLLHSSPQSAGAAYASGWGSGSAQWRCETGRTAVKSAPIVSQYVVSVYWVTSVRASVSLFLPAYEAQCTYAYNVCVYLCMYMW
jgi:hypothetical protein